MLLEDVPTNSAPVAAPVLPNPVITCGCANCTAEALAQIAGPAYDGNYSCYDRIWWLISTTALDEASSCAQVASEFPDICGVQCNPVRQQLAWSWCRLIFGRSRADTLVLRPYSQLAMPVVAVAKSTASPAAVKNARTARSASWQQMVPAHTLVGLVSCGSWKTMKWPRSRHARAWQRSFLTSVAPVRIYKSMWGRRKCTSVSLFHVMFAAP